MCAYPYQAPTDARRREKKQRNGKKWKWYVPSTNTIKETSIEMKFHRGEWMIWYTHEWKVARNWWNGNCARVGGGSRHLPSHLSPNTYEFSVQSISLALPQKPRQLQLAPSILLLLLELLNEIKFHLLWPRFNPRYFYFFGEISLFAWVMVDGVYCVSIAVICWLICVHCTYVVCWVSLYDICLSCILTLANISFVLNIYLFFFSSSARCRGSLLQPIENATIHSLWIRSSERFTHSIKSRAKRIHFCLAIECFWDWLDTRLKGRYSLFRAAHTILKRANFDENPKLFVGWRIHSEPWSMEYLKKNVCRR